MRRLRAGALRLEGSSFKVRSFFDEWSWVFALLNCRRTAVYYTGITVAVSKQFIEKLWQRRRLAALSITAMWHISRKDGRRNEPRVFHGACACFHPPIGPACSSNGTERVALSSAWHMRSKMSVSCFPSSALTLRLPVCLFVFMALFLPFKFLSILLVLF